MDTNEFIKRSTEKHGDRFEYSKSEYISSKEKLLVTCKKHGDFLVAPYSHMNGTACPKCSGKAKKTTEQILAEFRKVHGTNFDYSKVIYRNLSTPIHVICPSGHSFYPLPQNHAKGSGCSVCYGHEKRTTEGFIKACTETHGNLYDYSFVQYHGSQQEVEISCHQHGPFMQIAGSHLAGQGCPKCRGLNKDTATFIAEATAIHGDRYDYSKVEYIDSKSKVSIICVEHGEFSQSPNSHLKGRGCKYCAGTVKLTTETFIKKAIKVHGDTYDYSKTTYGQNNSESVTIICKVHGEFLQRPIDHLDGCGCPNCVSYGATEDELRSYVESLGFATTKDRTILEGKEIDVFVPTMSVGFEFNGLFWHSEKRSKKPETQHKYKTDLARSKGVRLIHIYEDDWVNKRDVMCRLISNVLGKSEKRVFARNCTVVDVTTKVAGEFMEANHLQGSVRGVCCSIGLMVGNDLVAVMQFAKSASDRGKSSKGDYELVRFATSIKVVGGASKLFKVFISKFNPHRVVSYSDNDTFEGGVYEKLGFVHISDVPADYKVIDNNVRKHKSNFRKSMLAKRFPKTYDPNLTEHENCINHKLYRIYNSGLKKWQWFK